MPRLDLSTAQRYVACLTGDKATTVTVQCFDDGPSKRRDLAQICGGSITQLWPWIESAQSQGAGVFCTVNETPSGKRQAADVTRVRALFCDFDGVEPPEQWHWTPTMVVQSGHGKHAYWTIGRTFAGTALGTVPLEGFAEAQVRLARHYGSDLKVKDLPRVMRLPGTLHLKDPANPKPVTFVRVDTLAYTWPMVLDRIAALPEPPPRPREPERKDEEHGGYANLRTFDVRKYFDDAGLLLCESRTPGRWFVHCPWSASHTGGKVTATSTVIYEGTPDQPAGFWCSHNSCDGRTIRDVRAGLSASELARYCQTWDGRKATRATTLAADIERSLPWNT